MELTGETLERMIALTENLRRIIAGEFKCLQSECAYLDEDEKALKHYQFSQALLNSLAHINALCIADACENDFKSQILSAQIMHASVERHLKKLKQMGNNDSI